MRVGKVAGAISVACPSTRAPRKSLVCACGSSEWESAQEIAPLNADTLLLCVPCPCAASMQGGIGIVLQPNNVGEMVIRRLVPSGPAEQSAKVLRHLPVRGLRVSCTLCGELLYPTFLNIGAHARVPGFRALMPTSEPNVDRCRLETCSCRSMACSYKV
jgi:hypothetical protein